MGTYLSMVLAQAISDASTGFREAARHAILAFVKAEDEKSAIQTVQGSLVEHDWHHTDCQPIKIDPTPATSKDETIRKISMVADSSGFGSIVYKDEIPTDAWQRTLAMLQITSFYAGLLALLFLALSIRVIAFRRSNRVSLGDGDSKDLRQRARAHGNFAEYTPIGLILLACVELQGAPAIATHLLGLMLLTGRALHARAFWIHPMNFTFRTYGMLLTFAMIGLAAVGLILHSLF